MGERRWRERGGGLRLGGRDSSGLRSGCRRGRFSWVNRRGQLFLSLCDLCCGLSLGGGGRGGLDNAFLEEPQHGFEVDPRQLPQVRLNYIIQWATLVKLRACILCIHLNIHVRTCSWGQFDVWGELASHKISLTHNPSSQGWASKCHIIMFVCLGYCWVGYFTFLPFCYI